MLEKLDVNDWLMLNAQLQVKKNILRKKLAEKGVLKKGAVNTFDKYSYFSEAQYKELFTHLFAESGLELKFTEIEYTTFSGSEKQSNGRMPKLQFDLIDVSTGFFESTIITGEGIDKGDKAGYKAYTGALKYYLANTFMVATGDDPEADSPNVVMNTKTEKPVKYATERQIALISKYCKGNELQDLLKDYGVKTLSELTIAQASKLIAEKTGRN